MEGADKIRAKENEEKRKEHLLMEEKKKAEKALREARRETEQRERMEKKEKQDQIKMDANMYKNDPSLQFIKAPLKIPIVTESKTYFHNLKTGSRSSMVDKEVVYKVELNGPTLGWRAVAKLAVRHNHRYNKNDPNPTSPHNKRVLIGLFAPNSHDILPNCLKHPSHHEVINRAVSAVDFVCNRLSTATDREVTGFMEVSGKHRRDGASAGLLRYILLSVQNNNNKAQLTLIWNAERVNLMRGAPGVSDEQRRKQAVLHQFVNDLVFYGEEQNWGQARDTSADTDELLSSTVDSSSLFHNIWVNYNGASTHVNRITDYDADNWQLVYPTSSLQHQLTDRSIEQLLTDHSDVMLGEKLTAIKFPGGDAPKALPKLFLPPFVFRQANLAAFQAIISDVLGWVHNLRVPKGDPNSDDRVHTALNMLELYGGVGTIGLSLFATPELSLRNQRHQQSSASILPSGSFIEYLHSSDENPHNKACFDRTVRDTPDLAAAAARLQYASLSATDMVRFPSLDRTGAGPANVAGLRGYHVVLVDPPRKGLDVEVREALCSIPGGGDSTTGTAKPNKKRKHQNFESDAGSSSPSSPSSSSSVGVYPHRLIYISCGFKAFQRDCNFLLGVSEDDDTGMAGRRCRWKLVHCHGYVLFPGSNHVETLAIFDRVI